jgi:hemolysin activation/secretion protein
MPWLSTLRPLLLLIWVLQDVTLTQQWLKALMAGGYRFPSVVPAAASNTTLQRQQQIQQQQEQQRGDVQPLPQQPLSREPNTTKLPQSASKSAAAPSAWAVVLSGATGPTLAVKKLAALPGWQVVVVADNRASTVSSSAQA